MATIAERIKGLRKKAGLTQQELGDRFGVAKSTICQYENGNSTPNDDIKIAMANYFNVSMDYLMGKTDVPGFDSRTPPVIAAKVTESGINMFHTYLDLSATDQAKVNDYVQILSEWESAYNNKNGKK
ncbi:helix-turn-helix domain-containing protein [Blautia obeum]|jgi:transcriptional regulator with XRE-family HTH domain|uniref:HTH cro/C1-type domain-containing protein n=1 Tax=Blautia obeum TaxID=40520 RepID=A0A367G2N5_9FIRM|nr:helix-turn-helix transcriptional regulator [Blautia obeum]RCH44915.1 hypothetical protein C4886_05550 [Blautia obeum]